MAIICFLITTFCLDSCAADDDAADAAAGYTQKDSPKRLAAENSDESKEEFNGRTIFYLKFDWFYHALGEYAWNISYIPPPV